jgi:hypothetical protein
MLAGGLSASDPGLESAADALIGPFDEEAKTAETEALYDSVSDLPDLGMQAYYIASSLAHIIIVRPSIGPGSDSRGWSEWTGSRNEILDIFILYSGAA